MASRLLIALCSVGFAPTSALQLTGDNFSASRDGPVMSYRQVMDNDQDLQYFGNMTVGGQLVQGILDTGSIEFVVISDKCNFWCGSADDLFHANASRSYQHGPLSLTLNYGSGQLLTTEAYDRVAIGPLEAYSAPFWEVYDADMPLLLNSNFEAIVGLGPLPLRMSLMEPGNAHNSDGFAVLLKTLHIERVSVCLEREPGSPGYVIWNDDSLQTMPNHFRKIRIPEETGYWMARLTDVRLGSKQVACIDGCGAVMDSGTSLISMPSDMHVRLSAAIDALKPDCRNLAVLPNLNFKLDGIDFSLPPDSYIGEVDGETSSAMANAFRVKRVTNSSTVCQAALMDISMDSILGPVWIMGMPFFRKFYSIFEQRHGTEPPVLYTALASSKCQPMDAREALVSPQISVQTARTINAAKIHVSPSLHRALLPRPLHNRSRDAAGQGSSKAAQELLTERHLSREKAVLHHH